MNCKIVCIKGTPSLQSKENIISSGKTHRNIPWKAGVLPAMAKRNKHQLIDFSLQSQKSYKLAVIRSGWWRFGTEHWVFVVLLDADHSQSTAQKTPLVTATKTQSRRCTQAPWRALPDGMERWKGRWDKWRDGTCLRGTESHTVKTGSLSKAISDAAQNPNRKTNPDAHLEKAERSK